MNSYKQSLISYLSLFSSLSTLVCCALPALLVSLGLGAAIAGITSNVPQLIWLSEHKTQVFLVSFFMLIANGYVTFSDRFQVCPVDEKARQVCNKTKRNNKILYLLSCLIFLIGFFFAFFA